MGCLSPGRMVEDAMVRRSTESRSQEIATRVASIRYEVESHVELAGRPRGSVKIIAVSKFMPLSDILAALNEGQVQFGESYAQELTTKQQELSAARIAPPSTPPQWHYIGPLQSNKVRTIAGTVALIHSVDREDLLEAIERRVKQLGLPERQACLVQVNIANEARKRGITAARLPSLLDRFAELQHVQCRGLMLIPPQVCNPEEARPHFAALHRLRDDVANIVRPNVVLDELSMGMSEDYAVAIQEGATIVRIGRSIFGNRPSQSNGESVSVVQQ